LVRSPDQDIGRRRGDIGFFAIAFITGLPGQSAVFCTLALHNAHPFDTADIVSIAADVFQDAYDFVGGGGFGPKKNVLTKEDADHNLPYLLSVAILEATTSRKEATSTVPGAARI
jgi:2-methylcitrate dehydratase PrpD